MNESLQPIESKSIKDLQKSYRKLSQQLGNIEKTSQTKIKVSKEKGRFPANVSKNLAYIFAWTLTAAIIWYCTMAALILFIISQNQEEAYSILEATIEKIFIVIVPLLSAASGLYFVESTQEKYDEN